MGEDRASSFARGDFETNSVCVDQHQFGYKAQLILPIESLYVEGFQYGQDSYFNN